MTLLVHRWSQDPRHPRRAQVFLDIPSHGERARLWHGWPPRACVCYGILWLWLPTRSPTVAPEVRFSSRKSWCLY